MSWEELRDSGLLWLINRVVFHPRGFALAIVYEHGVLKGWRLLGDGTEPWKFAGRDEDDRFQAVEAFFDAHRPTEVEADTAEEAGQQQSRT